MGRLAIDVSAIIGEPGASLPFDADVPLERVAVGDTVLTFLEPPRAALTISNTGVGLVAVGAVTGRATLECSRCLEPFTHVIEGSVESGYLPTGTEMPEEPDEEWETFEGETVDLLPAIEAALVVEVPFAPVHDEECLGICPTCGCDLNREQCECEPVDPAGSENPFAALKDLVHEEHADDS